MLFLKICDSRQYIQSNRFQLIEYLQVYTVSFHWFHGWIIVVGILTSGFFKGTCTEKLFRFNLAVYSEEPMLSGSFMRRIDLSQWLSEEVLNVHSRSTFPPKFLWTVQDKRSRSSVQAFQRCSRIQTPMTFEGKTPSQSNDWYRRTTELAQHFRL